MVRKIIHIDMDCFYAAVEIRDNPRLKGLPVAVGGRPGGRGVLTTANYEARKFGVRAAMPTSTALRLCPQLNLVPVHFSKYRAESQKIHEVFKKYTSKIEPLSLDEAYLDVSEVRAFEGSATRIAEQIRKDIFEATGLTASAGVAPNKFLAKVASDWNKPNGQLTVAPQKIAEFVRQLPVACIPGVGKVTQQRMQKLELKTCEDLQALSISEMEALFGSWGGSLYDRCRGIDNRPVQGHGPRKSLSVESTFSKDLITLEDILSRGEKVFDELLERLGRKSHLDDIKSIFVKMKFSDFKSTTVDKQLDQEHRAHSLKKSWFEPMLEEAFLRKGDPVRLLGMGVRFNTPKKKCAHTLQMSLFS